MTRAPSRRRVGEAGWSSLEVLIALIIALIAFGCLAAAAAQALTSGARLERRAQAIIDARNEASDALIGLYD
jgi:Tfp pilus assembly protein PilV